MLARLGELDQNNIVKYVIYVIIILYWYIIVFHCDLEVVSMKKYTITIIKILWVILCFTVTFVIGVEYKIYQWKGSFLVLIIPAIVGRLGERLIEKRFGVNKE